MREGNVMSRNTMIIVAVVIVVIILLGGFGGLFG